MEWSAVTQGGVPSIAKVKRDAVNTLHSCILCSPTPHEVQATRVVRFCSIHAVTITDKIRPCVCGEFLVPGLVPRPGPALEAAVSLWLEVGSVPPLERALLAGYGHVLQGRSSRLPRVANFLRNVPMYQGRIARIHEAAAVGNLTDLARLLDREAWAVSRDELAAGSTALQKAMLGGHVAAVKLLLHKAPCSLTATDRMGRAPLHYAAALDAMNRDNKDNIGWYQLLLEAGADETVKDSLGRTPLFYRECCSELLQRHECNKSDTDSTEDDENNPPVLVFHVTVEVREIQDKDMDAKLVNHESLNEGNITDLA